MHRQKDERLTAITIMIILMVKSIHSHSLNIRTCKNGHSSVVFIIFVVNRYIHAQMQSPYNNLCSEILFKAHYSNIDDKTLAQRQNEMPNSLRNSFQNDIQFG